MSLPIQSDMIGDSLGSSLLSEKVADSLSNCLLMGDKDAALRLACEQKLWSHALLIAGRISLQAWSNVAHEFADTELKGHSEAGESLRFLYQCFAGNTSDGQ